MLHARDVVGSLKNYKKINANEEINIDGLLAQAAHIMNNADAFLPVTEAELV